MDKFLNFFTFLENKKQLNIPLYTLMNYNIEPSNKYSTYIGNEIFYNGNQNIKKIYDNLSCNKLILNHCNKIESIGNKLYVEEVCLLFDCNNLRSIGNNIFIKQYLTISNCLNLKELPEDIVIEKELKLINMPHLKPPKKFKKVSGDSTRAIFKM